MKVIQVPKAGGSMISTSDTTLSLTILGVNVSGFFDCDRRYRLSNAYQNNTSRNKMIVAAVGVIASRCQIMTRTTKFIKAFVVECT